MGWSKQASMVKMSIDAHYGHQCLQSRPLGPPGEEEKLLVHEEVVKLAADAAHACLRMAGRALDESQSAFRQQISQHRRFHVEVATKHTWHC